MRHRPRRGRSCRRFRSPGPMPARAHLLRWALRAQCDTGGVSVAAELLGRRFRFQTAPGLFSTDRIDDGTRLLLAHLPETAPATVLDVGCGYGALGLPVAARH